MAAAEAHVQTHGRVGGSTYVASPGGVGLPVTKVFAEGHARTTLSATNFENSPAATSAAATTNDAGGVRLLETMSGVRLQKRSPLKKSFCIGALESTTNYTFNEHAFHKDDVPADKLVTKRAVQRSTRPDILQRHPKPFDISVQSPVRLCERRLRQIPDHDRPNMIPYNYRAELLPPKNPQFIPSPHKLQVRSTLREPVPTRTEEVIALTGTQRVYGRDTLEARRVQEMSVHPDLETATKWQGSTQVERRERMARIERDEAARAANSKRWAAKLSSPKSGYLSPQKRGERERKEQRERKRLLRGAGKAALLEATVTPVRPEAPPDPENEAYNRLAQEPSRKSHRYEHTGVWEHNEEIGAHVWSDTMGETKDDGLGDRKIVVNPDAWQYASAFKPKTLI